MGVDGAASNEAADMISEMHTAWHIHRAMGRADAVTVEDVVTWSSANGARLLGFDDAGTLEVGKAADLAVFDLSHPRYAGLHDPGIGPVVASGSALVRAMFVAGKQVVNDGAIVGLNLSDLAQDARRGVAKLQG